LGGSRRRSRSAVEKRWRQAGVGVTGGVRAVGEDVLGGTVLAVGSRRSEEGWSGLSMVARFGHQGIVAVKRRSSRGHRQGGPGSSRRRCGAQGGDRKFGGGPGRCFTTAQQWRHDGAVAAIGGGGKGCSTGGGLLLKAARGGGRGRRPRWAGAADEAVGGEGGGRGPNTVGIAAPLFVPCG
jgi:hypothetical protein